MSINLQIHTEINEYHILFTSKLKFFITTYLFQIVMRLFMDPIVLGIALMIVLITHATMSLANALLTNRYSLKTETQ